MSVSETRADRSPGETSRPRARRPAADPPAPELDPVVLSTRGLSVWYGSSLALKDITIDIPRNKITALIGPSGCGKSTLAPLLQPDERPDHGSRAEGEVRFDGELISGDQTRRRRAAPRIGMVFQKPNPFPKTIYNNVAWGARINGYRGDMDELVERSLRRAALWDEVRTKLNRSGFELSGGQQQRLCIARTLAVEPEVILMDEPCSALDPISTARVEDLMEDLEGRLHDRHRHPQHAASPPRQRSDRCLMLDEAATRRPSHRHPRRVQPDRPPLHQPQRQAHRGLHHRAHRLSLCGRTP